MTSYLQTAQSQRIDLLGVHVKQGGRTVHEFIGAQRFTTSSLTVDVEAATHAIQWLASLRDTQVTYVINLTDSVNLLHKDGAWNGLPQPVHSHAQSQAVKTFVDVLPWAWRSLWE